MQFTGFCWLSVDNSMDADIGTEVELITFEYLRLNEASSYKLHSVT